MSAIVSLASFPQKGFLGEAVFSSEGENAITVTKQVLEHLECEVPSSQNPLEGSKFLGLAGLRAKDH